jgi:hypothetical protein
MGLIFISHSSRDELAAAALRDRLLQHGYSAEGSIFLDSTPLTCPLLASQESGQLVLAHECRARKTSRHLSQDAGYKDDWANELHPPKKGFARSPSGSPPGSDAMAPT